jgi:ABC transport system ATP-binding/permease protein
MSESLLKAILQLFALVAREGSVTRQEREHVIGFLEDHVSGKAVDSYLKFFDEIVHSLPPKTPTWDEELTNYKKLCAGISPNLTQKQKAILILELVNIIQADGSISEEEDKVLFIIGQEFRIDQPEIELIKRFVLGKTEKDFDHKNILVVTSEPFEFKESPVIRRHVLTGIMTVLYLPKEELFFFRYLGSTLIFLNGVPVTPGKISVLAVGSFVRWDKDDPVYYGDMLQRLKSFGEFPRLSFEAKGLSFKFKNGRLGLRDVSLAEESGNLVALMGASGAGKSTLLHVLNGSERPSEGRVLINGIDIHKEPGRIEGVIGFVPQDDLLIEDLTVYQNLYYAAKLCFSSKSEEEINKLVMDVLEDLGLAESKDLKVGSPLKKTISGGQRKRLNIGLELLREPAVLFCDEPTSGLSSRDSENIIDLLKELSLKGKLVFAVIHQPSSDIFKMFDKLLILDTGGFQIYYGNPVDSVVHFKRSIELVNSEQGECHECGNVNPEQIFNIIETRVINEYGHFTNERKIPSEKWNSFFLKTHKEPVVKTSNEIPHSTLNIPTRIKQTLLFSLRDLQAKLHNTQYLVINLLEAPLLAFILAYIVRYYNEDDKFLVGYIYGKNLNMPAYFFMSVIVALFMGLTVSAEEIIRDRKILKREAFLHLSRSSYLLSKISILFSLSAIQAALFVLVGSSILKIEGSFYEQWFIMFTTSCFANMVGLNISSAFNSAVTIYILIPLLLIPQLILSGVVVKFDKLNPTIGNTATVPAVGDVMASRWAFEALMVSQFKDNDYEKEFYLYDKIMANSDFKKVYFVPEIETRLQFCINNMKSEDPEIKTQIAEDFELVRRELVKELEVTGGNLPQLDQLSPGKFTPDTYNAMSGFLESLKKFYVKLYNKADQAKEDKMVKLTAEIEKTEPFSVYRERYHNEAITELVKNMTETHRIIEKEGKLIQKIYPVYKDPDPDHPIDFDAQFYMPKKHFLNQQMDTFYFNTSVIWSMSFFLAILLYIDVLRRIIDGIGNIFTNPLQRRV